jgi:N-acetylmuramoyl-L-alanine amidase
MEFASGCSKCFRNADITALHGPDVRQAPFAVLRSTIPGALIELGHLSNGAEEKLLSADTYQNKLADAITTAVKKYDFA